MCLFLCAFSVSGDAACWWRPVSESRSVVDAVGIPVVVGAVHRLELCDL